MASTKAVSAWWLFTLVLMCPGIARAHDVMGTVFFVALGHTRARLDVEMPIDELRLALGKQPQVGVVALPASEPALLDYLLQHLRVLSPDGRTFTLAARPASVVLHDDRNWLRVPIDATPPASARARDFVIETDVITHRVVSHHIFVFVRHDLENNLIGDSPTYVGTLHYQSHRIHIQRAPGSLLVGLSSVFRLGLSHIAQGSDHLLFLFTLLLPAGLALDERRRWGGRRGRRESVLAVIRIVTAFTLGHSLTLLIGALGLARIPTAVVESLIAASILISAAHALVPIFPRREAWVAFSFGLVHGLGFASALEGLGVDGGGLALAVLGFNLGVEAMQGLILLVTLPWIFMLKSTRFGTPMRNVGAAAALVLALAWLAQRSLGVQTPGLALVDDLFRHGPWLVAALAGTALLARLAHLPRSALAA